MDLGTIKTILKKNNYWNAKEYVFKTLTQCFTIVIYTMIERVMWLLWPRSWKAFFEM